ncbi:protein BANP-like [Littorina saxatilis]|uniref:Protein BANP n=1 Tax=Littorina saxatilis TaxID=31220 RepID=A0AAN9C0U6_9CAEN
MTTEGDVEELQAQLQGGTVVTIQAPGLVTSLTGDVPTVHVDGTTAIIEDSCGEPEPKRRRIDSDLEINTDQSIKQILFNINKAICLRLDAIESKLETNIQRVRVLEERVESLLSLSRQNSSMISSSSSRRGAVIVGLPQNGTKMEPSDPNSDSAMSPDGIHNLGPNVTLITLNTEADFPSGTWLGDENNPEMRVRVPITPSDLLHVHSNCRTPEKMALTLLDYLFDRDTQAASNLSGMGKHGKKQLDPLMIYGIRCHLIHRFGITENDWHRIKQNIDSKCRTAWRRRQRGMPLTVKAFRGKSPSTYVSMNNHGDMSGSEDDSNLGNDGELHIHQGEADIQAAMAMAGEANQQGEIQILHATPEQISQLQHAQHIQILSGDQVIGQLQQGDLALPEGCHIATVTTDSGEVLQIQHNADISAVTTTDVTE